MGYLECWIKRIATAFRGLLSYIKVGYPFILFVVALLLSAFLVGSSWLHIWILLILGTILITVEMLNYSIERLCNLINVKQDRRIKAIKDICAGAVFLSAASLGIVWIWVMLQ